MSPRPSLGERVVAIVIVGGGERGEGALMKERGDLNSTADRLPTGGPDPPESSSPLCL